MNPSSTTPVSPTEPLTLKAIETAQRKYLNRNKRTITFRAKVESYAEGQGVLADETGNMNYVLEAGVTVQIGRTYEVTGQLRVENFRLAVKVISVADSTSAITSVGAAKLSAILIDSHSSKPIIHINQLLETRIGQSFFAVLRNIERSEGKVNAILADDTAQIQAQIIPNKKGITTEILDSLNEKSVYLCSDLVLEFTETHNLVARFNFRSKISESTLVDIKKISSENLSAKQFANESEKASVTEVIKLKPRGSKPAYVSAPAAKKQKKILKPRTNRIPATEPVTISNLEPWNRNQSFFGKILSLNVVNSGEPRNFTFLKGQLGDSTGVVDFDLAQKMRQPLFSVGQVVYFEKAINQGKEGRHFVEVKRFGSYAVVENHPITDVNQSNNLSEQTLPEQPPRPERAPKPERVAREPKERQQRIQKTKVQKEPRQREPRPPREPLVPQAPVKINQLEQYNNKQSVIGKVLRVSEETRANKENVEQVHLVGSIADETGAIDFDIIKNGDASFKNNDVIQLNLVMNKQSDGRHFVQIIQLGTYAVLADAKIGAVVTESVTPIPKAPREKKVDNTKQRSDSAPAKPQKQNSSNNRNYNNNNSNSNNNNNNNNNNSNSNNNNNNVNNNNSSNNNNNQRRDNRERGTSNNNSSNNNNNNGQNRGSSNNNNNYNNNNSSNNNNRQNSNNYNNNNRSNNNTSNNNNQQVQNRPPRNFNNSSSNNNINNNRSNSTNINNNNSNNRNNSNNNYNNNNNVNNSSNNNRRNDTRNNRTNSNSNSNNNNNGPRVNNQGNFNSKSVDSQAAGQERQQRELIIKNVADLFPGENGDNITGVVFEVNRIQKTINGKQVVSQKGRIADETANIVFDFTMRENSLTIQVGQTYVFRNLMNKVDDEGFHFVTVGKFGGYSLSSTRLANPNKGNGDSNLSTVAYEKKSVPTPQ